MLDNRQPAEECLATEASTERTIQPDIGTFLNESARESFKKLMKTAYEIALTPSMPHKHFKVLIKCQRANGVRLVEGKDGGNAAREFIHCIADAIKENCAAVIAGSHFTVCPYCRMAHRPKRRTMKRNLFLCEQSETAFRFILSCRCLR